jgi:DNA-binding transcriptional MerR regulator
MSSPIASVPATGPRDSLQTLRTYHNLAPWSLRDLAGLAGGLLEVSAVVPVNVAARARPSERTIRFYVSRGLVEPPEGRGTGAVYRYRHLLQILAIKLRQMEGVSLDALVKELAEQTGDVLERRVATLLGPGVPTPAELGSLGPELSARGRTARALRPRPASPEAVSGSGPRSVVMRRVPIEPGAELALEASHPLFRHSAADQAIARAVAEALADTSSGLAGPTAPAGS